jgi:crotonobetainyl-CoA:carnitine CoA-transferase CaiB-like acyl-CoA transferase
MQRRSFGTPPLEDIKVLDLCRFLAGPFATRIISDLGADVIRVLAPGDVIASSDSGLSMSEAFDWATNHDKRCVVLDLRTSEGRSELLRMAVDADVVVENFRPGVLERLGCGYTELVSVNPDVIMCSISGFGWAGPWAQMPAYDPVVQAASGAMDITGPALPGGPPCRWGIPIGDEAASLYAVVGILGALAVRDRDGIGQAISVSMLDCQMALATYRVPQIFDAHLPAQADAHRGGAGTVPYGPFRCSDGRWVAIGFAQSHWKAACRVMEAEQLASDTRFATEEARNTNQVELDQLIGEVLAGRPATEWETRFREAGAPAGKVNSLQEAFSHPQIAARGMIAEVRDEGGRVAQVAADPIGAAGETSGRAPAGPYAPGEISWRHKAVPSEVEVEADRQRGLATAPPLQGVRVVELDGNEPSKTLATQILADLGAEVVVVERPVPLRPRETWAAPGDFMLTDAFRWAMHRGKRILRIDLKDDQERQRFMSLVSGADVVYDNFRPGVKDRLGVDRSALAAVNPKVVTCSVTGFGAVGPWAHVPAYDVTLQALGGSMSITGDVDPAAPPVRWGHPIGGLAGALYGAIGVMSALRQVKSGAAGTHIDLSLLDVQVALHSYRVPQALTLGVTFGPQPRQGGSGARPYGPFLTKDERWFVLAITIPFWKGFCKVIGQPDLADDARFADDVARLRNAAELDALVGRAFLSRSANEWEELFLAEQLPGSPVRTLEEAFRDPSVRARGMLKVLAREDGGEVHLPGFPIVFTRTDVGSWKPPGYSEPRSSWIDAALATEEVARN